MYLCFQISGKSGVNVTAQNVQGDTPLHVAVNIDSLQKCQILLQFGGLFWYFY